MRVDARGAAVERPNGEARQPRLLPPGWEYRSALLERDADLAQFGSEGWECYSVIPAGGDQAMFYFKRRRG